MTKCGYISVDKALDFNLSEKGEMFCDYVYNLKKTYKH